MTCPHALGSDAPTPPFPLNLWEKVRREAGYPAMSNPPRYGDSETAHINLATRQIELGYPFVQEMIAKGMASDRVHRGILQHELLHHMVFPYDLETMILCNDLLQSEPNGQMIVNVFADVKINIEGIRRGQGDCIPELLQKSMEQPVMQTLAAYVLKQTGTGTMTPLNPELYEKLDGVNFYSRRWDDTRLALLTFNHIIKPYIPEMPKKFIDFGIGDFDPGEIRRAIRRLIQQGKLSSASADRLMQEYGFDNALRERYMALASRYPLRIEPIPVTQNAGSYPAEHREWSIDQPLSKVDHFNSFGLLIPGITQMWDSQSYFTHGHRTGHPDALIALDTSGSMIAHKDESPALIAAVALAQQYVANGSKVAPINFSTKTTGLPATDVINDIVDEFCKYQGNSTVFDLDVVRTLQATCRPMPDVHVITDTGIESIENVLEHLRTTSRPYIWAIGKEFAADGINIVTVKSAEDLLQAVIKSRQ